MYLRVNGVVLWSRGANVIPMEELEGRLSARAHVASARALEALLQRIRTAADVKTRSTIILQKFYSNRGYVPE